MRGVEVEGKIMRGAAALLAWSWDCWAGLGRAIAVFRGSRGVRSSRNFDEDSASAVMGPLRK